MRLQFSLAICRSCSQVSRKHNLFRRAMDQRQMSGPFGYEQTKVLVYSKYGNPEDVLSLHQHSITPSIPPDSLLLRTLATPINPADVNQIQGVYPSKPKFSTLLGTQEPSAVGGNEGCFEVVSLGSSITSIKKGDWVLMKYPCFGTWRTHALATEDQVLVIDKTGISPIQAATVSINPCTAYRLLKDFVDLKNGDWWIQNGSNSSVGRAAIQLGRIWGLKSINVIRERNDPEHTENLKTDLLNLGATHVITDKELFDRNTREKILALINDDGKSIKLGLNCIGGKIAAEVVRCLGKGGHLVTYGGMSRLPLQPPTGRLIFDDLHFSGFWVTRWAHENPEEKIRMLNDILDLIRAGHLKNESHREIQWSWNTDLQILKDAIKDTFEDFRNTKNIFVYVDT